MSRSYWRQPDNGALVHYDRPALRGPRFGIIDAAFRLIGHDRAAASL